LAGPEPSLREPQWTPDGRGLVFFQGRPQGFSSGDSYLVELDTKGKRLVFPGGRFLGWSPDGRYALWLGDLNSQTGERGLWRTRADGSQPDILAVDVGLLQASWTASADWVVYRSVLGGVSRLWLTRADRSDVKLLAEGGVLGPAWLPKTGLIYRSLDPQSERLVLLPLRVPR
ncbi:MAG TPA: hypothetical protein VJM69_02545, partial [Dehalococcoidia bacterium]|nr:hypothetical protein [Dehalococcoidia bacterium]